MPGDIIKEIGKFKIAMLLYIIGFVIFLFGVLAGFGYENAAQPCGVSYVVPLGALVL